MLLFIYVISNFCQTIFYHSLKHLALRFRGMFAFLIDFSNGRIVLHRLEVKRNFRWETCKYYYRAEICTLGLFVLLTLSSVDKDRPIY